MLEIKDISKIYSEGGVYPVSFTLQEGELCALLGKNGSGKTTLLHCILHLCMADSGVVLYNGKPVYEQYEQVAFISADGSSLPYMKVMEYGNFMAHYYIRFDKARYRKLCTQMEVPLETRICDLSKGQRMKVELAAGFSMQATLLILDEPFTSLDMYARKDVVRLLIEQVKEDTIVLMTTHDIEEVEQLADRCIVMDAGHMVEDFRLDDLHEQGIDLPEYLEKYR